ncbi:hypothetical protein VULLAG_LOCUS18585 [Vulpes lagopus]
MLANKEETTALKITFQKRVKGSYRELWQVLLTHWDMINLSQGRTLPSYQLLREDIGMLSLSMHLINNQDLHYFPSS